MKIPKLLKKSEITKKLKSLEGWSINPKGTVLSRTFTFKNHIDAMVFIARATVNAQVLDHHPEIVFTFKKVRVSLTTKDAGGITAKDIELAQKISMVRKSG